MRGCGSSEDCSEYKRAFLTPLRPSPPGAPRWTALAPWMLEPTAVGAPPGFCGSCREACFQVFTGKFNDQYNDNFGPLFQFERKNKLMAEGF